MLKKPKRLYNHLLHNWFRYFIHSQTMFHVISMLLGINSIATSKNYYFQELLFPRMISYRKPVRFLQVTLEQSESRKH